MYPVLASVRSLAPAAFVCAIAWLAVAAPAEQSNSEAGAQAPSQDNASSSAGARSPEQRKYTAQTLAGRVVWLEDALQRGFGVATEPDAAKSSVVLQTDEGRLWPIVPDTRGRAFAVDERLRDTRLELQVRRYADAPLVQVIRVFRPTDDGLREIDYWCDICAIPMVILKPCECCQGPTRLRERPVEDGSPGG